MEAPQIEKFLSGKLGADVSVTSVHQTFPGQSQETWLVEAEVRKGYTATRQGYVFRRNPPGGGIVPYPLRREWEVYVRLARSPVPVGEPLWWVDEDDDVFGGRPLFVRDLVEGSTHVPNVHDPDPQYDALREAVAKEHAEKLALVHTLDWKAYGFDEVLDAPASTADAPRHELETWRAIWDDVRPGPFPVVTEVLYWLEEQLPTDVPRVSLLKGNNGLGEEIWRDAEIVALSDWELASLGDPCQDWAFSQGMLALWDREKTLEHYERCAGFQLPRENIAFWHVWTMFKALCCTTAGLRGFIDGRDRRVVLPTIGMGSVKMMESFLAGMLAMDVQSAAQLLQGLEAARLDDPAAGGAGRAT